MVRPDESLIRVFETPIVIGFAVGRSLLYTFLPLTRRRVEGRAHAPGRELRIQVFIPSEEPGVSIPSGIH
jgi:hypothetical protein